MGGKGVYITRTCLRDGKESNDADINEKYRLTC